MNRIVFVSENKRKIEQITAILSSRDDIFCGIRVSECVALDIDDLNFEENSILIVRKGLKEQFVYFNDEVAQVLREYIEIERTKYIPFTEEKALFLSTQKQGISVRTIQQMVKKYSKEIVINKSLSPHKMRSTYIKPAIFDLLLMY